ncbi:hypothetical protein MMC06_006897 [Schaereria dolodes]|nr:hypothetical protein [Schaereria dolodes]
MPSSNRQVEFSPTPVYSRLPRDDEAYVMKAFARHASHCSSCERPYEVHRRGGTLCPKGHQRALDVAQYVYNKGGQAYSQVDREGHQRVQIEIPPGCEAVRSLLKAMERGLRLMKKAPAVSYDSTYYIQPRTTSFIERAPRQVIKPRLETAEPPRYPSRRSSSRARMESVPYLGKGSSFAADLKERERSYATRSPVYFTAAPRNPPPVPPKDYYWR